MSKHSLPGTVYMPLLNMTLFRVQRGQKKLAYFMAKWMSFGSGWDRQNSASCTSGVICSGHLWSLFQPESLGDAKNTSRKIQKKHWIVIFSETGYDGRGRCPEKIDYIYIYI